MRGICGENVKQDAKIHVVKGEYYNYTSYDWRNGISFVRVA